MLTGDAKRRFVVTHQNITERKLAEMKMQELSIRDSLTGLANRRRFKEFLDAAWEHGRISNEPVSLAFIDLDYFKQYNVFYGHVAGDICLLQLADILSKNTEGPGQLAARFGGDEFAIVFTNPSAESIEATTSRIYSDLAALNLEHLRSPVSGNLTISVGVATLSPDRQNEYIVDDLLKAADAQLYEAKKLGRNKVAVKTLSRN